MLEAGASKQSEAKSWPAGIVLRVKRWVESQRALYTEHRLSRAQLRYLAVLGKLQSTARVTPVCALG